MLDGDNGAEGRHPQTITSTRTRTIGIPPSRWEVYMVYIVDGTGVKGLQNGLQKAYAKVYKIVGDNLTYDPRFLHPFTFAFAFSLGIKALIKPGLIVSLCG